jgi:hypothetical protein
MEFHGPMFVSDQRKIILCLRDFFFVVVLRISTARILKGNSVPEFIGGIYPEIWFVQKAVIFINPEKVQPKKVKVISLLIEWI